MHDTGNQILVPSTVSIHCQLSFCWKLKWIFMTDSELTEGCGNWSCVLQTVLNINMLEIAQEIRRSTATMPKIARPLGLKLPGLKVLQICHVLLLLSRQLNRNICPL